VDRPALVTDGRREFPIDRRPVDDTPVATEDLPANPQRDRTIPATAWTAAPPELLALGDDLDEPAPAVYLRRIGPWLLWRAGPPTGGHTRFLAVAADDPSRRWTLELRPDGTASGEGPDGRVHQRFRTWKEALRDADPGAG
jgi:hypothetical protein